MLNLSPGVIKAIGGLFVLAWARLSGKRAGRAAESKEQAKQAAKEGDAERMYDLLRRKGD